MVRSLLPSGRAQAEGLADLEVGIFFAKDRHLPPAIEVVTEGAGADATEAVHLTYVLKFYCDIGHIILFLS